MYNDAVPAARGLSVLASRIFRTASSPRPCLSASTPVTSCAYPTTCPFPPQSTNVHARQAASVTLQDRCPPGAAIRSEPRRPRACGHPVLRAICGPPACTLLRVACVLDVKNFAHDVKRRSRSLSRDTERLPPKSPVRWHALAPKLAIRRSCQRIQPAYS